MTAHEDRARGIADAERARGELYDTLSQLKVQLNYAQRFDDAVEETKQRISEVRRRRPIVFIAGVAGATLLVGAIAWGVASAVFRRGDD